MSDMPRSFPKTELEALALEYVRAQELSGKTPAEIYALYCDAYQEMRTLSRENRLKQKAQM